MPNPYLILTENEKKDYLVTAEVKEDRDFKAFVYYIQPIQSAEVLLSSATNSSNISPTTAFYEDILTAQILKNDPCSPLLLYTAIKVYLMKSNLS